MDLYITSDLHLFHDDIIKYCDRPWTNVNDMNVGIIEDIKTKVPDEKDVVLTILGDLFYKPKPSYDDFREVKRLITSLKGNNRELRIVLGNHDRDMIDVANKMGFNHHADNMFTYFGFDYVYEKPPLIGGHYILSHEPYMVYKDEVNIHGHTHQTDVDETYFCRKVENFNMINVAREKSGMSPLEEEIIYANNTVNVEQYINVCWDKPNHEIFHFNDDEITDICRIWMSESCQVFNNITFKNGQIQPIFEICGRERMKF